MTCKQVQDLLPEYVDRLLKHAYLVQVEAHLEECGECRTLLAHYRQSVQTLATFPHVEPPPDLVEKIVKRTVRSTSIWSLLDRYLRVPAPVLLPATAAFLILLFGSAFYRMDTSASRSANKYMHQAWAYSLRLYGRAEGFGHEIASFKNIFFSILDRRVEGIQDELKTYKKQKGEQQSSQSGYVICDGTRAFQKGVSSHVLRQSSSS